MVSNRRRVSTPKTLEALQLRCQLLVVSTMYILGVKQHKYKINKIITHILSNTTLKITLGTSKNTTCLITMKTYRHYIKNNVKHLPIGLHDKILFKNTH